MKTITDIIELIEEEDVEFIRLQFTDLYGSLKNIAVTPGQLVKALEGKYSFEGKAMFGDADVIEEDLCLKPDPESFVILPWRPQQGKVGKMICDITYEDGRPFEMSPRDILKKVVDRYASLGLTPVIDPECEFFLFHTDENGQPTTVTHEQAGYMDVGPADLGENARRDMVLTLTDMGFKIESSHHEKAPGQHEIDFKGAESLEIADSIVTFKFAVRSIAKRFGMCATFMPKPVKNTYGSGMHLNIAIYDKNDKNVFAPNEGFASDTAMGFIGGIMNHAEGLCAITNPTVNSYKRLGSGCDAPSLIDWSTKGETALVKLHRHEENTKIEIRLPDPSANPYLAIAACLAVGLDGIEKKLIPNGNVTGRYLPDTLLAAVRSLETDECLKEMLGTKLTTIYIDAKKQEWAEYMQQVTDWEINRYLVKM